MFTGIIREIGRLERIDNKVRGRLSFRIRGAKLRPRIGDSIAVNGVCLTVTKKTSASFYVDVVPETLRRTNLGRLNKNAKVNLEPSLRLNEGLDGHFVSGHCDAACKVVGREAAHHGIELTIKFPEKFAPFIAEKGSVTINGVSLTIAAVNGEALTVALIPFTQKNTNLGGLIKGDRVNVEVDLIARYLFNLKRPHRHGVGAHYV